MPINHLYDPWMRRVCELPPSQRIGQVRNFVCLMVGIFPSYSVSCLHLTERFVKRRQSDKELVPFLAFYEIIVQLIIGHPANQDPP
jgi:hypothetical protein